MKKKIILLCVVVCLIAIEGISIYVLFKPTKETILENVKTANLKKDQSIAIMVQDTEGDGWHEQEDRSKWPSPTTHGFVGAKCTDSEGAEIDYTEILQFNLSNYTAEINTKNSIYCTLYFAKGRPLLQALTETKGTTLDMSNAVDGLYRYYGEASQVINNYICFGTSDKEECLKSPETYMYRIIGITSEADNTINLPANSLKLIKAIPSSAQKWYSGSNTSDIKWDASLVKTYLNGTFYSSINDAQPNGEYWSNMIINHKWYNADQSRSFSTTYPATEPKTSQTLESKIGLMYLTDYINAYKNNDKNNWLFLANGWSTNSSLTGDDAAEWTMARVGMDSGYCFARYITSDGALYIDGWMNAPYSVRPAFYIQSRINLTGNGKADDPFRITTMNNA